MLFDYYFFFSRSYTYTCKGKRVINYKLVRYSRNLINHLDDIEFIVNNRCCHLSFRYSNGIKHDHILFKCETRTIGDNRQYC